MFSASLRHAPRAVRLARLQSTASSTSSSSSSSAGRLGRYLRAASLASSIAVGAYTAGSLYPPSLATLISPRTAPPPPDINDPNTIAYLESLEDTLHNLPPLQSHRRRPDADDWYEARPYTKIPEERRVNSLTAGALRGPGKLALPPLVRAKKDESESIFFLHVGRGLCGHEGIIHGGLLATLLDESLGRIALLNLPDKIGVTANLNLNYRAPTRADQFIAIKTRVLEKKGRKVVVAGSIEDLQGTVLVEATAVFIQPKYAKLLDTKQIREYMGEPPSSNEPIVEGAVAPVPMPPDAIKDAKVPV
ncbi:Thioesterase/thiol ester dehydrase-isomerase [Cristinia sonorae]|uniref:Thioesterase/thiol ester dehydrase-isomerase n=1 Tax=Cristinia sonorae TaxID=1940300 RepID=A0A8K0XK44_9AGAR|nr:Thioesterase/thiol ester dehydrase-isomerase [Cristinia sonorae]